ncbi:MAG: HAD family hydrolase [bacterium]|nr:HAD family hydrolase [bacterium]
MYKVILFDLWNTIAFLEDIENVGKRLEEKLGSERFKKLKELFVRWHTEDSSLDKFLVRVDKEIFTTEEELTSIKDWLINSSSKLYPETKDVLGYLKEKGKKLVLITNSPPITREQVRRLDLRHYFDREIFSFEAGFMKPDPKIFQLAVRGMQVKPSKVLMIGDSLDQDIMGAKGVGFEAILIDRENKYNYTPKIISLLELKSVC